MGCDIHLFAEVKKKKNLIELLMFWKETKWRSIDKYTKNEDLEKCNDGSEPEFEIKREDRFYTDGRNYNLFSALCGVRSFHFDGDTPCVSEPKGLPNDISNEVLAESDSYGSDGHSHSWNTLKELKEFDWSSYGETTKDFLDEVIPKMEAQKVKDTDVRIVYFFDN